MTVQLGNRWECDNPNCKKQEFIPRGADNLFPKGWINTEMDGGAKHVVACSTECLGPAISAITVQNGNAG